MSRPTPVRFDALAAVKPSPARNGAQKASSRIEDLFGENVFNLAEMRARLPKAAFKALIKEAAKKNAADAAKRKSK